LPESIRRWIDIGQLRQSQKSAAELEISGTPSRASSASRMPGSFLFQVASALVELTTVLTKSFPEDSRPTLKRPSRRLCGHTRLKTITSRWPTDIRAGAEFAMPTLS
jgi:hypothetical protein